MLYYRSEHHLTRSLVAAVDSFSFDRSSYTSTMIRGPSDALMLTETDANGRDSTRTLVLNGKVAFHEIHTYNDDANLVRDFVCPRWRRSVAKTTLALNPLRDPT